MTPIHSQRFGSAAQDVHDIRALTAVTASPLQPKPSVGRHARVSAEPAPPSGGR